MKSFFAFILIVLIVSCNNTPENDTLSPGTGTTNETNDTSRLITDSVLIKDTNTSDVEAIKKIN